jgi:AcrR family transcriptional regulator
MDAATLILESADELFAELGFDATTTREIAARAGVNKALIHYHYESKDQLLERLLERYYDELSAVLAGALGADGDLRARFGALLDAYLDFLVEHRNFSRIVQREATGGRQMQLIQERMTPLYAMAIDAIDQHYPTAAAAGLAGADLLTTFYGMVVSSFTYRGVLLHLLGDDPLGPELVERRRRHLHAMLDLVFAALDDGPDATRTTGATRP